MDIPTTITVISSFLFMGGCLRTLYKRKLSSKSEVKKSSTPELIILDPSSLSFFSSPTLRSNYGENIRVLGIGQKGVTLRCYVSDKDAIWATNPDGSSGKDDWHISWESMMRLFPEYAKEIKLAAMSPEERELIQHLE